MLRVLDLFCGAGGAAMGYDLAGFGVVGVDIKPQPRYPFEFHRADAMPVLYAMADRGRHPFLEDIDVIHASPPCQHYSVASKAWNGSPHKHPDLIREIRDLLKKIGLPYIIENVQGAPLIDPVLLCGTMFGKLRVIRHRLFESNIPLYAPGVHPSHPLCYTKDKRKKHYGTLCEWTDFVMVNGGGNCSVAAASDAMGIYWMTKSELNEAIPPEYTLFLGKQIKGFVHKNNPNHNHPNPVRRSFLG